MIRRKLRTLEALVLLLLAWAALRIVPVRHLLPADRVIPESGVIPSDSEGSRPAHDTALAVRGSLRAAVARLPLKPTCLAQSLVAGWMLRRRKIPHRFHLGARVKEEFEAHAWVEAAGLVVAGEGDVASYSVMLSRQR